MRQGVNPNIILAKIQQLSWWTRSHKALARPGIIVVKATSLILVFTVKWLRLGIFALSRIEMRQAAEWIGALRMRRSHPRVQMRSARR